MCKRVFAVLFVVTLAHGVVGSSAKAQSEVVVPIPTQEAPPGFFIVEEERWYLMADEPGLHVGRAREAFLMTDARTAAAELRKAAVHMRMAASDAVDGTRRALTHSEHQLEKTAERVEDGTLKTIEDFDFATARAMHAMSEYQYFKAEQAWQKRKVRQAGYYLKAAADNIERASARTEARMKAATSEIARDSRVISGSLIEGTGYVIDDVGAGFERIGHQIERVGAKVVPSPFR